MKQKYQPRIRMFAGPNGSGKSVLKKILRPELLGVYINTVMSSADKIDFLKKAGECGYKTYLYFIATDSPEINVSRVRYRVTQGGHDVAKDKIISRYFRSLDLLTCAIKNSWRAYVFDNSGGAEFLLAESKEGKIIEIKSDVVPAWFDRYVIQKITK